MTIQQKVSSITYSPAVHSKGLADLDVRFNGHSRLSQVADRLDLDLGLSGRCHQGWNSETTATD